MQKVTTIIACHILLNRLHLDYVASWTLRLYNADARFLQICR